MDKQLLECPSCQERFQRPKSPACSHCFCLDCLRILADKMCSKKIPSAASFPCPFCRRKLRPQARLCNICDDATGKIVVKKQPGEIPVSPCRHTLPLSKRSVKEIRKFKIRSPSDQNILCGACGVVYLPNNQIVVSDIHNKNLKLFTDKGEYLDELKARGIPHELCLVDINTVAVAVASPGGVCVVKVQGSKLAVSSEINMPNMQSDYCYGIAYTDRGFVVSTDGGRVYSLTHEGVTDLLHKDSNYCISLAHDPIKGDILLSMHIGDEGDVAVSRLSTDKRRTDVVKFGGVVKYAVGIDTDTEGNMYVCGFNTKNVLQMTGDGGNVRELITLSDDFTCINYPQAISVCGDRFVITNVNGTDEDDYIRVFQLY